MDPHLEEILRKLVTDDEPSRLKEHAALQSLLENRPQVLTPDVFEKVWEHFFQAVWTADKVPLQRRVGAECCKVLKHIRPQDITAWMDAFWRVMLARWDGIDRHRISKFYLFVRMFIAEALDAALKSSWTAPTVPVLVYSWEDSPLRPFSAPRKSLDLAGLPRKHIINPGLGYHLIDIILEEIAVAKETASEIEKSKDIKACKKEMSCDLIMSLLEPFLHILCFGTNATASLRVLESVVLPLLSKYENLANDAELRLPEAIAEKLFYDAAVGAVVRSDDGSAKAERRLPRTDQVFKAITAIDEFLGARGRCADYEAVKSKAQETIQQFPEVQHHNVVRQPTRRKREKEKKYAAKKALKKQQKVVVHKTRRKRTIKRSSK